MSQSDKRLAVYAEKTVSANYIVQTIISKNITCVNKYLHDALHTAFLKREVS